MQLPSTQVTQTPTHKYILASSSVNFFPLSQSQYAIPVNALITLLTYNTVQKWLHSRLSLDNWHSHINPFPSLPLLLPLLSYFPTSKLSQSPTSHSNKDQRFRRIVFYHRLCFNPPSKSYKMTPIPSHCHVIVSSSNSSYCSYVCQTPKIPIYLLIYAVSVSLSNFHSSSSRH